MGEPTPRSHFHVRTEAVSQDADFEVEEGVWRCSGSVTGDRKERKPTGQREILSQWDPRRSPEEI